MDCRAGVPRNAARRSHLATPGFAHPRRRQPHVGRSRRARRRPGLGDDRLGRFRRRGTWAARSDSSAPPPDYLGSARFRLHWPAVVAGTHRHHGRRLPSRRPTPTNPSSWRRRTRCVRPASRVQPSPRRQPCAIPFLRHHPPILLRNAKVAGLNKSLDLGWDRLAEWHSVVDPCLPFVDLHFANAVEADFVPGPYSC